MPAPWQRPHFAERDRRPRGRLRLLEAQAALRANLAELRRSDAPLPRWRIFLSRLWTTARILWNRSA